MATKKAGKSKKKAGASKDANGAPKIITAKGGLSVTQLVAETLSMMEDNLRISKASAKDFVDSLVAVVEKELNDGRPVNLFHLTKIVPRLHTKGQREVNKEFGNPESGKMTKKYPAKVTLAVKRGSKINGAAGKEVMPTVAKLTKAIG